jgi:hypothetical protein
MSNDPKGFEPQYDDNKKSNILYFHDTKRNTDGSTYRKVELLLDEDVSYLSKKNADPEATPIEFSIKNDTVLYQSAGGQQKIHCWLMESRFGKTVQAVHISRRTGKGVYGSQEITLTFEAIHALRTFLEKLKSVDDTDRVKVPVAIQSDEAEKKKRFISEDEFVALIRANIRSTDDFYKLLSIQKMELSIQRLQQIIEGDYKNEVEIQKFLKDNLWMLGNDYVFIIENGMINAQNILDVIPFNYESYIDIIEVKLPREKLFNFDESHDNYYSTAYLTKAIAQTQNYIFELEKKSVDEEYQTKYGCKIIRPKGIILFGSADALNEGEQQYLRILNSSYHNLHVITYQQLLEKAQNTLQIWRRSDGNNHSSSSDNATNIPKR